MSNETLRTIRERRSIRAYQQKQVPMEALKTILDAGLASPSARNTQPWHFTAVQDAALLSRISAAFRAEMANHATDEEKARYGAADYDVFHHAPTVVFIACPATDSVRYAEVDSGIAAQTMALAACSLGLGSVILAMPRLAFSGPEGDAFRSELAFPEGHDFILSVAIGYAAATKEAHPIAPDRVTIL